MAAASDLQFALVEVKAAFLARHPGTTLHLAFGSSGTFYTQLTQHAPFDIFLSADLSYPKKLVEAGLADGSTLFRYSRGRLVLWVPTASPIPLERLGLQALRHPLARRVALANPRHAPYGRVAEEALARAGLLEALRPRLVFGENISQTAQFVQSGSADIGLLALSLAMAPALRETGRFWEVPQTLHAPLDQGGVMLNRAQNRAGALAFLAFLRGPEAVAILRGYGFTVETP